MILAGATYSEIGRLYGLSRDACRKRRKALGLPPRQRKRKRIAAGPTDDEYGHIEVPGMPTKDEIAARALALRAQLVGSGGISAGPARCELMVARRDRRRR